MFDVSRFEELYREYYARIFEYCLTKISFDRDCAAEAADNVFVTLYRKWDKLTLGENVKFWLYRTADNFIKKQHKKKKRTGDRLDVFSGPEDIEDREEFASRDVYFKSETSEDDMILEIRDSVSEEYRELFKLRYVEKKTLEEISSVLDVPYSTLRRRIAKLDIVIKRIIHEKLYDSDIES